MAKNKRKSFSKVTVSRPVLTNLDKIPSKLDILENSLSSEKVIEIPQDLNTNTINVNTEEPKFSDKVNKNLRDHEYKSSQGLLYLGESNNVTESEVLTKQEETTELEVLTKQEEIIVSEIDNKQDKNISNEKKNTIELTEVKILNEDTIQSNNKSINCSRKYCCIL